MTQSTFGAACAALTLLGSVVALSAPAAAETVMQQCGQQYQAAKAANTLNGMTWPQYRTDCSARLKATPAVQTGTPPAATPVAATPVAAPNPLKPAALPAPMPAPAPASAPATPVAAPATTTAGKPMSPGRTAFVARERECGTEWKANKATLTTQTPGLTWPKYLSQCNARLKSAGQ